MKDRARGTDVPFTPFDKLFEPTGPQLPTVATLPLDALRPFEKHPFHLYTDEKLTELAESIKTHGILMPLLVRPLGSDAYEIVSGHNRAEAAKLAGLREVPVTIRELDDDTAIILMVDSNLRQRETLLPSEKAWAYRLKLEALRHQGKSTSAQVEPKLRRSNEVLANQSPDSRATIQRYIRLTHLIPPLLDYADNSRLAFNTAVELSYLSIEHQTALFALMEREENSPSLSQAQNLHKLAQLDKLDTSVIEAILLTDTSTKKKVTFRTDAIAQYFHKDTPPERMETIILQLLSSWHRSREQKKSQQSQER